MSYLSIARKYRPDFFGQVFGQTTSKRILVNSILMNHEINAMLITGIRGTGKTTLARIYAKSLNCLNFKNANEPCNACESCLEANNGTHPDIHEFDAASNNGVDFIRDLEPLARQRSAYERKVIIFDEVHMFTPQAQNAFLKLLEEPPKNLTFILVTTEAEKLLGTIRSRCLSMPLKPLSPFEIEESIKYILTQEGKEIDEGFVTSLSLVGGGALRDVQQILDNVLLAAGPNGELNEALLEEAVGIITVAQYKKLAAVLTSLNLNTMIGAVREWHNAGMNLSQLYTVGIPALLRDCAVCLSDSYSDGLTLYTGIPYEMFKLKLNLSVEYIKFIQDAWVEFFEMMKEASHPKIVWEMFFVKICQLPEEVVEKSDY